MKKILSNIYSGWITIQLEDKKYQASYLEDTPQDILDALSLYIKKRIPQVIKVSLEENGEIYIIFDWYITVVEDEGIHNFGYRIGTVDFARKYLKEIKKLKDKIINDFYCGIYGKKAGDRLQKKINTLEKLLTEGEKK